MNNSQLINPCRTIISLEELIETKDLTPYLDEIEKVAIYTEKNKSYINFGCYAYLKRESVNDCTYVDPSTLDPARVFLLQNLLDDIANDLRTGKKRIISVWSSDLNYLNSFFYWLDSVAPSNSLTNEHELNLRYAEYTAHLLQLKAQNNNLDDFTSRRQHAARKFFRLASTNPKFSLGQGVPIIARTGGRPTPPPKEQAVTENLAMAYQLFNQLTDFVLGFAPYPFTLILPKESVYVLPCNTWALTKARLAQRALMEHPNWRWDYETGQLNTLEYVAGKYGYQRSKAKTEIAKSAKHLKEANEDSHHRRRLILATWAQTGFQILMLSTTGMDLESFRNLPWSDDIISVPSDRQGFRVYKARAKKHVYFEIQSAFVPMLNKYLKLRNFILNGKASEYLFFRIHNNTTLRIDDQFLQTYHDRISHMLDRSLPRITAIEYRKYKANWILDNKGLEVASLVSQNTPKVFSNRYSSSARGIRLKEFTRFYSFLTELSDAAIHSSLNTPSGSCVDGQKPTDIGSNAGVEKDCNTFWGCLFCTHYGLHADAEDLYKLKSIGYVIEIIRDNTQDFTTALLETMERAKFYINLILDENPELNEVNAEIDKKLNGGSLYSYWQAYIDLWALTGKIK